jgi:hypothetical protein
MPALRSPDLEAVFRGPLDSSGITEEAIGRLILEAISEGEQLDFKAVGSAGVPYPPTRGPRPPWTEEQEFAKDVAALANHRGGLLLVGVTETAGIATALTPIVGSQVEAEEQRLRQALRNYQTPFVQVAFVTVNASRGGWYLAVVVPPSQRAPHAVLGDPSDCKRPLRYPVRHGRDTIWLTEHEVAERYRRRLSAQEDQAERSQRTVDAGIEALRRSDGLWIYVAVVPELPASGRLDKAVVQDITDWHHGSGLLSPLQRTLLADGRGIPAPGRVTFSMTSTAALEEEPVIRGGYLELHVDGAAFAAKQVQPTRRDPVERTQIGDIELVDDLIVAVDVVLRWCAHRAGAWGTATVTCGLVHADTDDGGFASPLTLVRSGQFGVERYPGTRLLTGVPASSVVADLAAVESVQERLAVTYLAVSSMLQWFGVAEPEQLRADGTIVPANFDMTNYREVEVERWARDHNVHAELLT